MHPVTQKMIAERLGVHSTTVSMALRAVKSIPEVTRQRIVEAAHEMGYQPNAWARNLRAPSSHTIGIISSLRLGDVMMDLLAATAKLAQQRGYEALLLDHGDDPNGFDAAISSLVSYRVAGAIVCAPSNGARPSALQSWQERGGSIIHLRACGHGLNNSIDTDREAGCRLAIEHLAGLQHRHIALACLHNSHESPTPEGLPHNGQLLHLPADDEQSAAAAISHLLKMSPRPTALICPSDLTAVWCIKSLLGQGLRVPEDISVVGFDDSILAQASILPLTTLARPVNEMAELAVQRLTNMIAGTAPRQFDQILVPPTLVVRQSTAKAP